MTSAVGQLFQDYVREPMSPSSKCLTTLPIRLNTNTESVTTAQLAEYAVQRVNATIRRRLLDRKRFKDDHHDTCMFVERSKNLNVVAYQANLVDGKTGAPVRSGAGKPDCVFKHGDPLHAYWIKIEPEHVARRRARGETEDLCELNMVERKLAYGCNAAALSCEKFVAEMLPDKASRQAATAEEMEAIAALHSELQPCLCRFVALSAWHVWMVRLPGLATENAAAMLDTDDESSTNGSGSQASRQESGSERGDRTPSSSVFASNDTVVTMLAMVEGELSIVERVYVASIEPKHFYQLPKVEYIEVFATSLRTGKTTYEKRQN